MEKIQKPVQIDEVESIESPEHWKDRLDNLPWTADAYLFAYRLYDAYVKLWNLKNPKTD
jgi:hypothetical protein